MTKHSHLPCTSTYSSTPHNTNRKHNINHIPYTNTQHTSTLQVSKTHYFQQWMLHNKHSHSQYNRHKSKHAPYTYIYMKHPYKTYSYEDYIDPSSHIKSSSQIKLFVEQSLFKGSGLL